MHCTLLPVIPPANSYLTSCIASLFFHVHIPPLFQEKPRVSAIIKSKSTFKNILISPEFRLTMDSEFYIILHSSVRLVFLLRQRSETCAMKPDLKTELKLHPHKQTEARARKVGIFWFCSFFHVLSACILWARSDV